MLTFIDGIPILAVIAAGEVGFWLVLAAALVVRYGLRLRRLSRRLSRYPRDYSLDQGNYAALSACLPNSQHSREYPVRSCPVAPVASTSWDPSG